MTTASPIAQAMPAQGAPAQQPLPSIAPAADAVMPRIEITGRLRAPAELRVSPGGGFAHLVVQLVQPAQDGRPGMPITARYSAPADELPAMEALSFRLLAGTSARVTGYGMHFNADRRTLKLSKCIAIRELPRASGGGVDGLVVTRMAHL